MPTEEKMVDLDTSGEGAEVNLEEQKEEVKPFVSSKKKTYKKKTYKKKFFKKPAA